MYLKDKTEDNWSQFADSSMQVVSYDDGSTKPFDLSDIVMTFGKYSGRELDDIDDVSYLKWLANSDNEFQALMANKRLEELV